jgi:hypothetical protein
MDDPRRPFLEDTSTNNTGSSKKEKEPSKTKTALKGCGIITQRNCVNCGIAAVLPIAAFIFACDSCYETCHREGLKANADTNRPW